jgi:hypothetical protein
VGGGGVDDLDGAAGLGGDGVHHGGGFAGGIVVQAQDDQIHTGNQSALGGRVLAQSGSMLTSSTPAIRPGVHGSADPWFRLRRR